MHGASRRRGSRLVGHSHVALCFSSPEDGRRPGGDARAPRRPDGTRLDIREGRWLLNPGSVGQPRDGDPRAAWLELDTEAWTATYRRIPYEIDRAAECDPPPACPTTSRDVCTWANERCKKPLEPSR